MSKHEFGLMPCLPEKGKRYDAYTPEKYVLIAVEDDDLNEAIAQQECLCRIPCYWHTTDHLEHGLAYYGVTLIPPQSAELFCTALDGLPRMEKLCALFAEAARKECYIIHFGI
ncbi:MAG: hypothetical protein E7501_03450 [Ruminococcus sp.]|nr:hypothetical protein [Ruminococcus sp.]